MFEARQDQAMGLRRLFGTPGIRVLPFACGAQPGGSAGFVLTYGLTAAEAADPTQPA